MYLADTLIQSYLQRRINIIKHVVPMGVQPWTLRSLIRRSPEWLLLDQKNTKSPDWSIFWTLFENKF